MHILRQLPRLRKCDALIGLGQTHVIYACAKWGKSWILREKSRYTYQKKIALKLERRSICPLACTTWNPRIALIYLCVEKSFFFWLCESSYFLPIYVYVCVYTCPCTCWLESPVVCSQVSHMNLFSFQWLFIPQFFLYDQQPLFLLFYI